jgi:hypothetical protein
MERQFWRCVVRTMAKTLRIETVLPILPAAAIALVIAEMFYKFHSFTLECLAFLGTWYVIDLVTRPLVSAIAERARGAPAP